jgi:hypothetical protein
MSDSENLPDPLKDLIDDYLGGLLDEARTRELDERLRADAGARRYFVRYARLHTDLHLEARAHQAGRRALGSIEQLAHAFPVPGQADAGSARRSRPLFRRLLRLGAVAAAAAVVLAAGAGWWLGRERPDTAGHGSSVAWLVNAQNCQWSDDVSPAGDMRAGKVLTLERGLAEVEFRCGARLVLEGPARLELLSARSARLVRGKLTARVPAPVTGFEIVSPQGKVIDLGTEFGVAVADGGATEVYVFEGQVEAHAAGAGRPNAGAVNLVQNQAARIEGGQVTVRPEKPAARGAQFVRAIVPPPVIVPRTFRLTFDRAVGDSLCDAAGLGTGLTHRLPGTGGELPKHDPNLRLNPAKAQLELTTTNSDINTQYWLESGEYLGVRLADFGFTGPEDFAVTVTIPNIPALESVGQFGLYAAVRSDKIIRGGLISRREPGEYTQFLVNNDGGSDADICRVGLHAPGTDHRLTLKRTGGKYALTVENLTTGSTSALTIRHPEFLDGARDLYVGLFGANTQSNVRKTLFVKEFQATVWTAPPTAR